MDLHHEPVLEAHARHLGQHLRAEQLGVGRRSRRRATRSKSAAASAREQVGGLRRRVAVVGGRRADRLEEGAPLARARRDSPPRSRCPRRSSRRASAGSRRNRRLGIDDGVGAEGRDAPGRSSRSRGSCDGARASRAAISVVASDLDVEALKQRARAELGPCQRGQRSCRKYSSALPALRRSRRCRRPLRTRGPARAARACRGTGDSSRRRRRQIARGSASTGPPSRRGTPSVLERDALAVEHAEDVVIGHDEQRSPDRGTARCRRTSADPCGRAG